MGAVAVIGGPARREFDGWFVEPAPYPVRSGNSVRPLIDGEPAHDGGVGDVRC
jgi:hypothetical protein